MFLPFIKLNRFTYKCNFKNTCKYFFARKVTARKKNENILKTQIYQEESPLDLLLKNLNPHLGCDIKDSWIDPNCLSIEHLLGRGKHNHFFY